MTISKRGFLKYSAAGLALTLIPAAAQARDSGLVFALLVCANQDGAFKVQLSKDELRNSFTLPAEEWGPYLSLLLAKKAQGMNGKIPGDLDGKILAAMGPNCKAGKKNFQDLSFATDGWKFSLTVQSA